MAARARRAAASPRAAPGSHRARRSGPRGLPTASRARIRPRDRAGACAPRRARSGLRNARPALPATGSTAEPRAPGGSPPWRPPARAPSRDNESLATATASRLGQCRDNDSRRNNERVSRQCSGSSGERLAGTASNAFCRPRGRRSRHRTSRARSQRSRPATTDSRRQTPGRRPRQTITMTRRCCRVPDTPRSIREALPRSLLGERRPMSQAPGRPRSPRPSVRGTRAAQTERHPAGCAANEESSAEVSRQKRLRPASVAGRVDSQAAGGPSLPSEGGVIASAIACSMARSGPAPSGRSACPGRRRRASAIGKEALELGG